MLFNSYEFVFVFLPLAFALFWYGGRSLRWRLTLLTNALFGIEPKKAVAPLLADTELLSRSGWRR